MKIIKKKEKSLNAVRLTAMVGEIKAGAILVYFIKNDSHKEPYALLEDLFVREEHRKKGIGRALMRKAVAEAKKAHCYKVICTSRVSRLGVHLFYKKLGLKKYGFEFRLDL